ncbi:MAG: hypothetical protein HY527_07660, partial [Betaproteobacteria bacterium]|nr:hypothetical protein [Betaproteobacteria bacterium]
MSIKAKFLLALVLTFCAALAHADPPARAGRLNYLSGTVSFAPAQAPDAWAFAALNRPLTTGDRLWADRDGYAELHVGSTAVRLAPRTNVDILSLDDHTLQLRLAQGDVNVRVRELADDAIEIDTPSGAVLLEEPGSYRISAHPSDDTTSVIVHSGRAQVLTPGSAFAVNANQQVTLQGPDGAPSEIAGATVDAFDRWSAELDKREDQVAARRYVSPQMTGYEDLDAYGRWRTMPEYGAVWVPTVAAGWAPYRYGHWVWIEPWGWTWIDDAPWGFAPFHYGRWVWLNGYWAWAPGPIIARPVYAPALVAFVGGAHWSVSIGSGPAVGWFPLGWREPYFPWYRTSPTYVRNVNITHVKNINIYNNVTRINYANQALPQATTVVSKEAFVSAKPVARSQVKVAPGHATGAPVLKSTPAEPTQTSFAPQRAGPRPPAGATTREVFAARTPPARRAAQNLGGSSAGTAQPGRAEGQRAAAPAEEPRVRVIERPRGDADASVRQRGKSEPAPRATAPDTSTRPPQADTRPQPKTAPQPQRDVDRGRRSAEDAPPQARPDVQQERRAPGPSPEARPRPKPEREPRAERAPAQPAPQARPSVQQERRAPGPSPEARPRPKPEREPRAERAPAQPAPQARPP